MLLLMLGWWDFDDLAADAHRVYTMALNKAELLSTLLSMGYDCNLCTLAWYNTLALMKAELLSPL